MIREALKLLLIALVAHIKAQRAHLQAEQVRMLYTRERAPESPHIPHDERDRDRPQDAEGA